MHPFDILLLVLSVFLIIMGIKRGFVSEIFRLTAIIAGFIAGVLFYKPMAERLSFLTVPATIKVAMAFLTVYIVVAFTVIGIGWILRKIVHLALLGWLDRILGGVVGSVKAVILAWIIILCITIAPFSALHAFAAGSRVHTFFTALPLRLKVTSSSPRSLTLIPSTSDALSSIKKLPKTIEKIGTLKQKVDSAKSYNDSIKKRARDNGGI